jgi:hypothetical protein
MKIRYGKSMAVSFMVGLSLILIGTGYAMIRTLSVDTLVAESEYIVIAQVYSVSVAGIDPAAKMITLRNEMKPVASLKGRWPSRELIVLTTRKHEEHWIEDNVELPLPGTKVLLFLTRYQGGLVPVNGIQGVWPMQGDKLLQMGTGRTLDEIRGIIRDQKAIK